MKKELIELKKNQRKLILLWTGCILAGVIGSELKSRTVAIIAIIIMCFLALAALVFHFSCLRCPYCSHWFRFWPIPHYCPVCGKSMDPSDSE